MREPRTQFSIAWMAVAGVVHAAVLAGLLVMPVRHAVDGGAAAPAAAEIAILVDGELAPTPPPLEAPAAVAETSRPSPGAASVVTARGAASGASSSEPRGPSSATSAFEPPPSGASSAGTGGVVAIPRTLAELGVGGPNPFLPRAEEKVPTTGPDAPVARAMRGTGLAHDRELGLGPEGPVVKALADATSSSLAPVRGRAVFIVRSGGDGLVLGIDVIDSEGGTGWADAGRIALESLRGKKLVVPRGANGMNMRIEVRSDWKLPNGQDAPFGSRLGDNNMPELTIPDVSNIGAKPRRVVKSRAVSTEVL